MACNENTIRQGDSFEFEIAFYNPVLGVNGEPLRVRGEYQPNLSSPINLSIYSEIKLIIKIGGNVTEFATIVTPLMGKVERILTPSETTLLSLGEGVMYLKCVTPSGGIDSKAHRPIRVATQSEVV